MSVLDETWEADELGDIFAVLEEGKLHIFEPVRQGSAGWNRRNSRVAALAPEMYRMLAKLLRRDDFPPVLVDEVEALLARAEGR